MKLFLFCAMQAALAVAVFVASGAGASAKSSTERSRTRPSGWTLLHHATKAQARYGTARGDGFSRFVIDTKTKSGTKQTVDEGWFAGDATTGAPGRSSSNIDERTLSTTEPKPVIMGFTYITKGKKLETRATGAKTWTCRPYSSLNAVPEWTPTSFAFVRPTGSHLKVTNRGEMTLGKSKVWRVLASGKTKHEAVHVIVLVDAKTYDVRAETILQTVAAKGIHEKLFFSLSLLNFGEHFQFRLPKRC